MSIFRPLNSSESNLFTIRCSLGTLTTDLAANTTFVDEDGGGANQDSTYLLTPTVKSLPTNFKVNYVHATKIFEIEFGKAFTTRPTINVSLHYTANAGTNDINYFIDHRNLTAGAANARIYFEDGTGAAITPGTTSGLVGFDILIVGPVKLGVTTGNSNKGWAVSAGNDATDVYSYMNVGVATGDPQVPLHVDGAARFRNSIVTDQATGLTLTDAHSGCTFYQTTVGQTFTLPTAAGTGIFYKFLWAGAAQNNVVALIIAAGAGDTIIGSVLVNGAKNRLGTNGAGTAGNDLSIGNTADNTDCGDFITLVDVADNTWCVVDSNVESHTYA